MKNRYILILFLIVIFAFALRFYQIADIPSFHGDEVDFANNAWSVLKTGRDQDGNFLPIATTSIGDLRPAVYMYMTVASEFVFGFNEFAARLPSVIFSVLTVVLIYFLADDFFKDKKIAIISSLLLAMSFWHISLSREASEKVVALFFVTLGIWLFYRYLNFEKIKYLLLGLISLSISIQTYYSPRIFLLIFLPVMVLFFWKKKPLKTNISLLATVVLICLLTVFFTFFYGNSRERINQLSVINNPRSVALMGEQISEDGVAGATKLTRIFHNKITAFGLTTIDNYLEYFSPKFLFTEGGFPQRIKIPGIGLVNMIEAPFILVGISLLLKQLFSKWNPEIALLFIWIVFAFVPAAFTFDEIPNVYRTSLVLPPLIMVTAYGMSTLLPILRRNIWLKFGGVLLSFFYVSFFGYFLHQYFVHFEYHQPWYRNYAHKVLAQTIKDNYSDAKIIFVPQIYGGVEAMIRFYDKFDPAQYQKDSLTMDKKAQHYKNIIYTAEPCPYPELLGKGKYINSPDYVFVDSPDCRPQILKTDPNYIPDMTIYWKDTTPAYEVIKGKKEPEKINGTKPI